MTGTYEQDLVLWAREQVGLLREGRLHLADIENIAEELEGVAVGERRELRHRLVRLLELLLENEHQPERHSSTWYPAVVEQRTMIEVVLETSPSLQARIPELMARGYARARRCVSLTTGIDGLPEESPWTFEDAMTKVIPQD